MNTNPSPWTAPTPSDPGTGSALHKISQAFARSRTEGRATFMPFFTVGFPNLATSIQALEMLVEAGADALEIGMPFSDPLADGPTIQHASQVALANGTRMADCIGVVRSLRQHGITVPLILMGYLNPLLRYGIGRFVDDAAAAGASGFIVPDLPPEEAGELLAHCRRHDLGFIPLLAPNSTMPRVMQAAARARGFLYLVSVTGVTGARDSLPSGLAEYVERARGVSALPLAVGFGISRPEQARLVAGLADGIIVASALIREAEAHGLGAMRDLAASLRAACVTEPR